MEGCSGDTFAEEVVHRSYSFALPTYQQSLSFAKITKKGSILQLEDNLIKFNLDAKYKSAISIERNATCMEELPSSHMIFSNHLSST